jgi:hypothetical protein
MKDNKKFWLITLVYLFMFWILPIIPKWIDIFFGFFESILELFKITISFALFYYFLIIPIIITLSYLSIIKIKLKFKNTLFVIFYILIPYTIGISYFLYALAHININFIG